MSQIVKRKKGRPRKVDLTTCAAQAAEERDIRRSLRRRNVKYVFDLDDYFDDNDELFEDDEDQRRREKKLKHLLKLQNNNESLPSRIRRVPATSASSSDNEDGRKTSKKRKIYDDYENDEASEEEEMEVRERKPESRAEEDSPLDTPSNAPYRVPLPDKKALELILDKLQKKDIYSVYAEPVDPEELPDYHEVIKNPMDFATVRNKLRNGSYVTLEKFENDVLLICSNAMQYNEPDTVYHKQARSIQELAKRKFNRIRLSFKGSEKEIIPELKISSCPTLKKQIGSVNWTVQKPVGSDFSSGATLATSIDIQNVSNAVLSVEYERPGSVDRLEGNSFLNDNNLDKGEESLSGKGPLPRYGKKSFIHDENRRATYSISLTHSVASPVSIFSTFEEEIKQLVPVGLYSDHSYARSLARFSANLGSIAWNIASMRIEQALPEDLKFGRGWVGDYEPLPTPALVLENCIVKEPAFLKKAKEPAFLKKALPASQPRNIKKIPIFSDSLKENPVSGPFLERKLPFLSSAGIRPPYAPINIISSRLPEEHQIRGNVHEVKQSSFISPITEPRASPNLNYLRQNSQSRISLESDKKVSKEVELNNPSSLNKHAADPSDHSQISKSSTSRPIESTTWNTNFSRSGSFKQPDNNGISGGGGFLNGKHSGNTLDHNTIISSSSDFAKPASYYPNEQGQGLSDPVQLMRMLAEKSQNQQKPSNQLTLTDSHQVFYSAPSSNIDSNNAAAEAARVWMSVGSGGFRPTMENINLHKNQIYADPLYNNSTRDVEPQFSRMQFQPDRNNSQLHAFGPQGTIPMMRVGNEAHFQNQQMGFPQFVTADLSRFQMPSNWHSISPQMHSRQKPESLAPDLNIGFQSSGSLRTSSSGVLVDSQQPDLALQL